MIGIARQSADVYAAPDGYDRAAPFYDAWHWTSFWSTHELPVVRDWLRRLGPAPLRILDAGCGTGRYRADVQSRGHEYIGVDVSPGMLTINARKHVEGSGRLIRADMAALPPTIGRVHAVLCTRTLAHVERPENAVREFARVLASRGRCLLTDIHPEHAYDHTGVRGPHGKVSIRSFKHPLDEIERVIRGSRDLELVRLRGFTGREVLEATEHVCSQKLRAHPDQPLFYVCEFRKR